MEDEEKNRKVFEEVLRFYLGSSTTFGSTDGRELNVKTYLTPEMFVSTRVYLDREGFLIETSYNVGAGAGRLSLIEKINGINSRLRQGCLYVEEDGGLMFGMFIHRSGGREAERIADGIKTSIITFLEIFEVLEELINGTEDPSDDEFRILDVEVRS